LRKISGCRLADQKSHAKTGSKGSPVCGQATGLATQLRYLQNFCNPAEMRR
jgi:hypothetical protein